MGPAEAKKLFTQSLALRQKLGNESDVAESFHNLGELLRYEGDVADSGKNYDAALTIRELRGEAGAVAESRLGKAELFLDTDKAAAEPLARAAADQFKKQQQSSEEVSARATLAQALWRLGRVEEANSEIARATDLAVKNGDRETRLKTEIVASEVLSAKNLETSLNRLRAAIHDAEASGLFVRKLQAGLAMAEIEMKCGKVAVACSHSEILQKDAAAEASFSFHARPPLLELVAKCNWRVARQSAEERYVEFVRVYPIAARVPQSMLAAFRGVTPETHQPHRFN